MILKPNGNQDQKDGWDGVRRMINNPNNFLSMLQKFADKDRERLSKITKRQMDAVIDRINNPENQFGRMQ